MCKRLRDLREDRDLTQTQIAKYLGMSQTGYSKYETGENDIPTAILIKLSDFYDTSIDYLLGQTNIKKRNKSGGRDFDPLSRFFGGFHLSFRDDIFIFGVDLYVFGKFIVSKQERAKNTSTMRFYAVKKTPYGFS